MARTIFAVAMRACAGLLLVLLAMPALSQESENPPMPGFNAAGSDARAIAIADSVMASMGGRKAWDDARFITWRFFGRRLHAWDKHTGDARLEQGDLVVLHNIGTKKGRAWRAGVEITHPDSLAKALDRGYRAWINDSYWVFMPYKLKDSGVTLKYKGEGQMQDGKDAYILELTFESVGVTPQNKYDVYVNKSTMLVEEWAFYQTAADGEARFKTAWHNWQPHGSILLSDDRGRRKHSDIAVFDELPAAVFTSPEKIDLQALPKAK